MIPTNRLPNSLGAFATKQSAGSWHLRRAVPERTESGPDYLMLTYEGRFDAALLRAPSLAGFARGATPPGYSPAGTEAWGIATARPSQMWGPFWACEVTAKGRIATQTPKVRWTTGAREFQAEDVTVTGLGQVARLRSRQPEVGVEISYLHVGTKPSVAVGVEATPSEPRPANPTNIWSAIPADKAVFYAPKGWVREGFDADEVVPGFWWCTERYAYVFPITG
jgi:hypothetical protein